MTGNEIWRLSIGELSSLIKARKISCRESLDASLARLDATEPLVHAWVSVFVKQARADAEQADKEIMNGQWRGPLHGVPIGIKDVCDVEQHPTRAGSGVPTRILPQKDAVVVMRLRQAGALILGKTVTHEFAYGLNDVPTRNPWNPEYWPGGSSVGSAVSVAVGSSFGAIGTDSGGSIRNPASINGVVGVKPTLGRVSPIGIMPMSQVLDCAGTLTRSVSDAVLLLQVIASDDDRGMERFTDAGSPIRGEGIGILSGKRLGVELEYFSDNTSPEVADAFQRSLELAESLGAVIVSVKIPSLRRTQAIGTTIMMVDMSDYHRSDLLEYPDTLDPRTRHALNLGHMIPATLYRRALRAQREVCDKVDGIFHEHKLDALIAPTLPHASVPLKDVSSALDRRTTKASLGTFVHHTIPANVTGQPSVSLPCGTSSAGIPIGVQLIGRRNDDVGLLSICSALEDTFAAHSLVPLLPVSGI